MHPSAGAALAEPAPAALPGGVSASPAPPAPPTAVPAGRTRRAGAAVRLRNAVSAALIALACLLAPCGTLAAWAAHGLTDTGRYVGTMAPLAADPDVRDAVADAVGDGVVRELGAETSPAVGPFVRDAVRSFTRTEAFRTAWEAGNRAVHDAVLRAVRDERAAPGPVTVDLAPVTAEVKQRLVADRVPFARRIPVEHTRVAVVPARDVPGLRKGYQVLETAALWLPLAAVALAVAGIAVAGCRRRALTATGLGAALGGALLGLAVLLGRRLTLADLPERIHRPAAGAVYDALTAGLRTASWLLLALGLGVALLSWLTGHRHRLPGLRHRATASGPSDTDTTAPPASPRTRV